MGFTREGERCQGIHGGDGKSPKSDRRGSRAPQCGQGQPGTGRQRSLQPGSVLRKRRTQLERQYKALESQMAVLVPSRAV